MEQLNERIVIFTKENSFNENGFPIVTEKEFYSCWANYKAQSGKEFIASYTNNSEITVSFRVRYSQKLKSLDTTKHFIRHRNNVYNIVFIKDDSKDYWDIKCVSVNGGA